MVEKINGLCYKNMLDYGMRNLQKHRKTVNKLNVFPVPDGDTGTNMLATVKNGLGSINDSSTELSLVSTSFANAVVFGARGNSGVIMSQFFKGLSEVFEHLDWADADIFIKALRVGVIRARDAVDNPVDGTILTVLEDATAEVESRAESFLNIDELIVAFIERAKSSLENTPELLPALKNAGVVDSGGAGMVYFFEGIKMYLDGEDIEITEDTEESESIDYSAFNKNSSFDYGYCTEFLLQLLTKRTEFDYSDFKSRLSAEGESLVLSVEKDKVKLHIHTHNPGRVMNICQEYGEFLFTKIENMTVQHTESTKNILCSEEKSDCSFHVVAVAYDRAMQKTFLEMGADVVLYCDATPSTKELIEALEMTAKNDVILFPNSSDAIFPSMQASNLYKKAKVTVVNCKSTVECYGALAMIDYCEESFDSVINNVNSTIENIFSITIAHSKTNLSYGHQSIGKNQYYAFNGKTLLATGESIVPFAQSVIRNTLIKKDDINVITLFYNKRVTEVQLKKIISAIEDEYVYLEFCSVETESDSYDLVISFE